MMPEEAFATIPSGKYRENRAPNFVGGTGDIDQPGVPTPVTPPAGTPASGSGGGGGTPTTPAAPRTRLGQLVAPAGGGQRVGDPMNSLGTPERRQEEIDRYRRGRAALTGENLARVAGYMAGIGPTTPITTAIGEAVEATTGIDTGLGFPHYKGQIPTTKEGMAGLTSGQYATANEAFAADDARAVASQGAGGWGGPGATEARDLGGGGGRDGSGGFGAGPDIGDVDVGGGKRAGPVGAEGQNFRRGGTVTGGLEFKRAGPVDPNADPSLGLEFQRAGPVDPDMAQWVTERAQRIMTRPPQSWTQDELRIIRQFEAMGGKIRPPQPGFAAGGTVQPRRMGNPANTDPVRPLPGFLQPPTGYGMRNRPLRDGPNNGGRYATGGTVRRSYRLGGEVIDPAAVPDDGVVDNVPINADEGEFVLQRAAAEALGPEVLRALNDPAQATALAAVLTAYLQRTAPPTQRTAPLMQRAAPPAQQVPAAARPQRMPPVQQMPSATMPARPTTRLGQLRAG
jgi:hypothetical protein